MLLSPPANPRERVAIEVVGAFLRARRAALLRVPAVDAPLGRTDFLGGMCAAGINAGQHDSVPEPC